MSFVIQNSCRLINDKISDINYDFIFNHKFLSVMLAICLPDYIALSFCEVVINDQKYPIHDFNNFYNKADLKLLLYYYNLCNIRTKKYAKTETFIKIK